LRASSHATAVGTKRVRRAPLYATFTVGFDAPDLVEAEALLAELR
jgi:hypothetical protein